MNWTEKTKVADWTVPKQSAPTVGTKNNKVKNIFKWSLLLIILISFIRSCSNSPTVNRTTQTPTTSNVEYEITKALATNKITGCGEYTWTANSGQNSEYTVRCSSDGKNWTTYTVWTKIERVISGTAP